LVLSCSRYESILLDKFKSSFDNRVGTHWNLTPLLQMITWKPVHPVTPENEIESDDCEATIQLLPMRAIIDQRAIQFVRAFFHNEDSGDDEKKEKWTAGLHLIPPPRFRTFGVKPWKLKVDYNPQKLDVGALRDGSIVELINISPIDGMVITLSQDSVEGVVGFGDVMGGLTSIWLQEIVATQLHKFLANARPFEPITDVGQGMTDLVVLPYEAFKNGEDVRRAMGKGVMSLAETVTFQALTTTSRLTEYAANKMSTIVGGRYHSSARNPLPARPTSAPKGVQDVTGHAMESIYRGIQAANHKIVIIPFREYERHGATSAATSVLRGIPVMLVAPVTGATEALSYTLLGARNALRPDIRREEEASRTGFTSYE
jgi:autophagy-related protein 2